MYATYSTTFPQAHLVVKFLFKSYSITPDISIILLYTFYQPIFYATHDEHFPPDSEERVGYWVGFAEHCHDSLTHKVLDAETL